MSKGNYKTPDPIGRNQVHLSHGARELFKFLRHHQGLRASSCWWGHKNLAKASGLNVTSLRRYAAELAKNGLLYLGWTGNGRTYILTDLVAVAVTRVYQEHAGDCPMAAPGSTSDLRNCTCPFWMEGREHGLLVRTSLNARTEEGARENLALRQGESRTGSQEMARLAEKRSTAIRFRSLLTVLSTPSGSRATLPTIAKAIGRGVDTPLRRRSSINAVHRHIKEVRRVGLFGATPRGTRLIYAATDPEERVRLEKKRLITGIRLRRLLTFVREKSARSGSCRLTQAAIAKAIGSKLGPVSEYVAELVERRDLTAVPHGHWTTYAVTAYGLDRLAAIERDEAVTAAEEAASSEARPLKAPESQSKRKTGPDRDIEAAKRVAEIIEQVTNGGGRRWRGKLDDICEALDGATPPVPCPQKWLSRYHIRTWCKAAVSQPSIAIKAIEARLENARKH